jgi:hypothetical protein
MQCPVWERHTETAMCQRYERGHASLRHGSRRRLRNRHPEHADHQAGVSLGRPELRYICIRKDDRLCRMEGGVKYAFPQTIQLRETFIHTSWQGEKPSNTHLPWS